MNVTETPNRGKCPYNIHSKEGPDWCELNTKVCILDSGCSIYNEELEYAKTMEHEYTKEKDE